MELLIHSKGIQAVDHKDMPTDTRAYVDEVLQFILDNPNENHVVTSDRRHLWNLFLRELIPYTRSLDLRIANPKSADLAATLTDMLHGQTNVVVCSKPLALCGWTARSLPSICLSSLTVLTENEALQFASRARDVPAKYFIRYTQQGITSMIPAKQVSLSLIHI